VPGSRQEEGAGEEGAVEGEMGSVGWEVSLLDRVGVQGVGRSIGGHV